jgi:hypothetical protein
MLLNHPFAASASTEGHCGSVGSAKRLELVDTGAGMLEKLPDVDDPVLSPPFATIQFKHSYM